MTAHRFRTTATLLAACFSRHGSGLSTALSALDDLRLVGDWQRELPGSHIVELRKPGYVADPIHAYVGSNQCHVETEIVQAEISVDPRAAALDPIFAGEVHPNQG
jgi:hypothetical protein